jgi:hypothetical protein
MNDKRHLQGAVSPSVLIDERIAELGDWRGEMLALLRTLIRQADPDVVEEWKWRGTPVWSHDGIVCMGDTYKSAVKTTFAKGGGAGRRDEPFQRQPRWQRPARHRFS